MVGILRRNQVIKYVTNFARTCFDHWTASKAISEFVQNWLDSDGERDYTIGDDFIELTNKNIKVSNKLLMMGKSDKRNDPTKRGRFGVGSLQSMVVLIDLGIDIEIHNNDVTWKPVWERSELFNDDVMVIIEQPKHSPDTNFTVVIRGLDTDTIDEIKLRTLLFQDREVLYSTKYGDVIATVDNEVGEIFVGDLYVCRNASFSYSYNFKPEYVKLCQDRNLVSQWDLQELTAKLIVATNDHDFIKESILAATLDVRNCQYHWDNAVRLPMEVNDAIAKDYLKEHGNVVVYNDSCEYQDSVELGNKCVLVTDPVIYNSITRSGYYKEAIKDVELITKDKKCFVDLANEVLDKVEKVLQNNPTEHLELLEDLVLLRERIDNKDYD